MTNLSFFGTARRWRPVSVMREMYARGWKIMHLQRRSLFQQALLRYPDRRVQTIYDEISHRSFPCFIA